MLRYKTYNIVNFGNDWAVQVGYEVLHRSTVRGCKQFITININKGLL